MKQRIELIDSLRGFSLLGILLANLLIFQYGLIGKDYVKDLSMIDTVSYYFTKIFVESSFMPIFTFLFGYSLIKFVESIKRRQAKTRWVLIRRAIGLIVIGSLHAKFLWDGDILLFYGGISFILLFLIYRKPKTLFIWAGLLFIVLAIFSYGPEIELYDSNKLDTYLQEEATILSTGTYTEIVDYRQNSDLPFKDDEMAIIFTVFLFAPILILPMFFIGMACAKLQFFRSPDQEKGIYKKLMAFIFVGVLLKSLALFESNLSVMLSSVGGPLLSIGYIGAFALFYHSVYGSKFKTAFAAVGKLSLSNYLLQSCICTFIFYGYGFGLFGTLGVTYALVIGFVIYICQLYLSHLYLHHFSRGPIEMVLRLWTNFSWRRKAS